MQKIEQRNPSFTVELPNIPQQSFSITDYGGEGDGFYDNTEAIHKAIQACSEAGGGRVVIPPGIWRTGPIRLVSKLELHAEQGAIVLFSDRFADYPLIESSFEGQAGIRCQSPLDGQDLEDIAITGQGTFDGSGHAWRPVKKFKMTDLQWNRLVQSGGALEEDGEIWWPTENAKNGAKILSELQKDPTTQIEDYLPIREFLRPNLLSLRNCKRILLNGPTFQHSPAWNLHPWCCQHITIQNVNVKNPWYSQNGDGLDLESCRYAIVKDSHFDVGDDAICIKSGKDEPGRELGIPSEDILIEDCTVYSGHGGFVVGSEMSGGVRNIHVRRCSFFGTDVGIRFKTVRGRGGTVEHIDIEDIRMNRIANEAIVFLMYYETNVDDEQVYPVNEGTPHFQKISMRNITCTGADSAIVIKGLPEMPIQELSFENIAMQSKHGISSSHCHQLQLDEVVLQVEEGPTLQLKDCKHVKANGFERTGATDGEIKITGKQTENIQLDGGVATSVLQISSEVDSKEVHIR